MDISDLEKTLKYFYENRNINDLFTPEQIWQNVFASSTSVSIKAILSYLVNEKYVIE